MNRQQRRAAKQSAPKKKPVGHNLTVEEKKARLLKNGITPEDMKTAYSEGYEQGVKDVAEPTIKAVYAAVCLAMNKYWGFGAKRCTRLLRAVDAQLLETIATQEIIQEVWDKMHLQLSFDEPFDRIEETQ